jgi:hypothetical protein
MSQHFIQSTVTNILAEQDDYIFRTEIWFLNEDGGSKSLWNTSDSSSLQCHTSEDHIPILNSFMKHKQCMPLNVNVKKGIQWTFYCFSFTSMFYKLMLVWQTAIYKKKTGCKKQVSYLIINVAVTYFCRFKEINTREVSDQVAYFFIDALTNKVCSRKFHGTNTHWITSFLDFVYRLIF